jgi:predicted MarR family transcription regulator
LLRLAPSSVATLTHSLRQAGLVTRTGGAGDRRTASLDLTPVGEAAVLRWKTLNERLLSQAQAALPPGRRSALADALPALADLAGAVDALADLAGSTGTPAVLTGLAGQADEPPAGRTASQAAAAESGL